MKLLVIIVTYNAMQWAERCFSSLKNSTVRPDVFVVDNGSTDGTQAFVKAHYPEVMFHQSEENLGFGKANNMGLQYALDQNYDYVYLMNQDAWVLKDTFERLIHISDNYPEYGILSPFQMNSDMSSIDNNFYKVLNINKISGKLCLDTPTNSSDEVYDINYIMAAHWFVTSKCIKSVGGFSPVFSHYGEDNNYADRALYKGFKIGVIPSLLVVHDRDNRKDNKEKLMYFQYVYCVTKLSSTTRSIKNSLFACFIILAKDIYKFSSFKPLSYLFLLISNYGTIVQLREKSISEEHAFLSL